MTASESGSPPKRRRKALTAADVAAWEQVVRRVKPLPDTPPVVVPEEPELPSPAAAPEVPDYPRPLLPRPSARRDAAEEKRDPLTHGSTAGVDRRTAERFKRGDMEIEANIDLHGMTREAAHRALTAFIHGSATRGRRVVLVVTGKGRQSETGEGILKAAVPRWLNEPGLRSVVLSFSYAQPRHGGEGALYVFLKRERNKP